MPTTPPHKTSRLARSAGGALLALVCVGVAACGSAASGDTTESGALDTRRLPRVAGSQELYATPYSTLYTTKVPVTEAAGFIKTTLTSGGWQSYVAPFTDYAQNPDFQILSFKKGPQALQVSVALAPAQDNATSVSYTGLVLANDLPIPADASDIAFSPERPYLSCQIAKPVTEALDYFTKELAVMGWKPWSRTQSGMKSDDAAYAFYLRNDRQPLRLVLQRGDDRKTKVEIEAVPPEMLTAELTPHASPKEPERLVSVAKPADRIDAMIEDAVQKMNAAILAATGEVLASAGKPTAQRAKSEPKIPAMPKMPPMPAPPPMPEMPAMPAMPAMPGGTSPGNEEAAAKPAEPTGSELVAEDMNGFPIPESHTSSQRGETKFRIERAATVPAPLAAVLAFYRRELPKFGWKEMDMDVNGDTTVLKLATPTGQGDLTLTQGGDETAVSYVEKRESEAKKAGILPKSGHARLILGSMAETPATVTIGKKTLKVAPDVGAERPDGPSLDLPPGTYTYSVKIGGEPPTSEKVVVAEGETWALVIGPGGGSMPLHMY